MATKAHESDRGFAQAVAGLSRLLLPANQLSDALDTIACLAPRTVAGCDSASVSLLTDDAMTAVAASDERARKLDRLQVDTDEGPCLDAIRKGRQVVVRAFTDDSRYRSFGPVATAMAHISSCMSLPLTISRSDTVGSLNLYAERTDAYAGTVDAIATRLAQQATLIVTAAMAHERTTRLVSQLQAAMISRAAIEQAKGILMARSRISADEAFDVLRRASQRQNVKLRDVARQLVDNVDRPESTPPG